MSSADSVTQLIDQLRHGDRQAHDLAACEIWHRYSERLLNLARRHLAPKIRRREDEEDVVQSMYKSFCKRHQRGEFDLSNRDELWTVLVTLTLRKAHNAAARQGRQRRDYRREVLIDGSAMADGEPGLLLLEHMAAHDPTPAEAALLAEEFQARVAELPDSLRPIALWKLEGFTNEEIAADDKLNCAVRTVERKLERIRKRWHASVR